MDINLKVEVDYIRSDGEINNATIPSRKNEFSGVANDLLYPSSGQRVFQLSSSGKRAYGLSENIPWRARGSKYNGFISYSKCDGNGIFQDTVDTTLVITGTNIDAFVIYFDSEMNEYAKKLSINGIDYANTSVAFAWKGTTASSFTIIIKEWSRPNVSARVASFVAGLTVTYSDEQLLSVKRGLQTIADNTALSWNVLGQYGRLSLSDFDRRIKALANSGILKSGTRIPVRIILDGKTIGTYIGSTWNYNVNSFIAEVSLVSNLQRLENVIYNGYSLQENKTNYDAFLDLKDFTERNGFIVKPISIELQNHFTNGKQPLLELRQGNLRESWGKFCVGTSVNHYFNELDELELVLYE